MTEPRIIRFEQIGTAQAGFLSIAEQHQHFPFEVKRFYWLYDTPDGNVRGNQMHRTNEQVLVAVKGRATLSLENLSGQIFDFELHTPNEGVYIPSLYWRKLQLREQAVVLALSSHPYMADDSIRDYQAFQQLKNTAE